MKRGQASIEYMILLAFVTFMIMIVLSFSIFFSSEIRDRIKLNQVENFAVQLINAAETVFFAGEPSKTTVVLSLPEGVEEINFVPEGLYFKVLTGAGLNSRLFESSVPLEGSISVSEGIKKITLTATNESVVIS